MKIAGTQYSRSEVLRRVGHISQIGGTRPYQLVEGAANGLRAVDFDTGAGLRFTLVPDRGMDISAASYNGLNLAFRTPNWETAPAFAEPEGFGWLRTFFGGLLTTCGLTYFSHPCTDEGVELGLHGRCNLIPAQRVRDLSDWQGDEYVMSVTGVVEECVIFGHRMRLTRTVSALVGARSLRVHDVVTNFGYQPAPFTILYHINAGFPLLSARSQLLLSRASTEPLDAEAVRAGLDNVLRFSDPVPGCAEQVFLHRMIGDARGWASAALVNPDLGPDGLGLYVRFPVAVLPVMAEWKMMGEGDYVLGMEPCNVDLMPRAELRKKGLLPMLAPGAQAELTVEIGILEGPQDIHAFTLALPHAYGGHRPSGGRSSC